MEIHLPTSESMSLWISRIVLAVVLFVVSVVLLVTLLVRAFPNALQGDITSGGRHDNIFRNFVELFYFISSVLLLVVTVAISIFARHQLIATRRAAQADVYISLANTVLSQAFVDQSTVVRTLALEYERIPVGSRPTKTDFLNRKLNEYAFRDGAAKLISLLAYIEHIAILIRRRHLSMDDAYLLLEGQLIELEELFMDYLIASERNRPRMWEHTIWLLPKIKNYALSEPLLP